MPCTWPSTGISGNSRAAASLSGRQVVQVEEVGGGGAGQAQLPGPGLDLELVGLVVEGREDRILGAGAVLVGAVHRRGPVGAVEAQRARRCAAPG